MDYKEKIKKSMDALDFMNDPEAYDKMEELKAMEKNGLVRVDRECITVLPAGRMLVRVISMVFDRYLRADRQRKRYSKVI